MPAHKIVSLGMAHVPEGRRIFQQLTVLDNLKLGAIPERTRKKLLIQLVIGLSAFSTIGRAKKADCRHFERRRTADAGNGAGFDVRTQNHRDG